MNNSVIEIISIIIKRMLRDDFIDQEEVINELVDQGYELDDIDNAFALILSEENIIEDEQGIVGEFSGDNYNRIFTASEKMYLPMKFQGLIYRLIIKNVLSPAESEKLITRTIKKVYNGSVKVKDFWNVLKEVIDDDRRLELISKEIPEFNDFLEQNYKYVN